MVRLSPAQYASVQELYCRHSAYFPLIAAVLGGEQDGVVCVDSEENPGQAYVEHAFGFAQVFGTPASAFERNLHRYLLGDKSFTCPKVRLYTPYQPAFLHGDAEDELRSWRQHFRLDPERTRTMSERPVAGEQGVTLKLVDAGDVGQVESAFGVVGRFWRTPDDFVRRSNAVLVKVDEHPATLCYAAAVAGGQAEIDVLTLPAYRHLGLAKLAVESFSRSCLEQGLLPLWDCFTNNAASMALCQSTGFVPLGDPYPFFTISRKTR